MILNSFYRRLTKSGDPQLNIFRVDSTLLINFIQKIYRETFFKVLANICWSMNNNDCFIRLTQEACVVKQFKGTHRDKIIANIHNYLAPWHRPWDNDANNHCATATYLASVHYKVTCIHPKASKPNPDHGPWCAGKFSASFQSSDCLQTLPSRMVRCKDDL